MKVRVAKHNDVTAMVIFAKGQHAKSAFKHIVFNTALFRKNLYKIIKGGNGDVLIAVNPQGQIRGMLIAWHEPLTWSHQKIAVDIHFVAEQGGDMLLRAFKKWAIERQCCEIGLGTFNGVDEDRIENLYNHLGFATVGKTYRMELKQ